MDQLAEIVLDDIAEEIKQGLLTKILKALGSFFKRLKCKFSCCAESSCSVRKTRLKIKYII